MDAELAWVGETERKLASLGPLSLEPDVTVAQLQVQRAFNIDIIRHKDTVDQLLHTREDILESCNEQQRETLKVREEMKENENVRESYGAVCNHFIQMSRCLNFLSCFFLFGFSFNSQ